MNRQERQRTAEQTLAILREGGYVNRHGVRVDIAGAMRECVAGTRLVRPREWDGVIEEARARCGGGGGTPPARIEVTAETTLAAARRLVEREERGDVAALNFASAKNPGGGFLSGSGAQEESLARASGLFPSLESAFEYYEVNRRATDTRYTDHAILSPRVPVLRGDDGALLDRPYPVTFITMPAVNVGALKAAYLPSVPTVMRRRMDCVLALAAGTGHRSIVLGAWGCGVFRNDPATIASLFAQCLTGDGAWRSCFDRIVFAVYDSTPTGVVRGAFERELRSVREEARHAQG